MPFLVPISATPSSKTKAAGEREREREETAGGGGGMGGLMGSAMLLLLVFLGVFLVAAVAATRDWRRGGGGLLVSETMGPGVFYTRSVGRCTPQFWSSETEAWPKMVPHTSSLLKVFGSTALEHYEPGLTLLEATQRNDDVSGSPFSQLIKESSAALLNSYARPGYPYDAWEVKTLLVQALVSEEAAAAQAMQFAQANEACN